MPATRNKVIFNEVYKDLEQIRKDLKKCKTEEDYNPILDRYTQIDTKSKAIIAHITSNKSANKKLVDLEGKIAVLIVSLNIKFELEQPENELEIKKHHTSKEDTSNEEHKKHSKRKSVKHKAIDWDNIAHKLMHSMPLHDGAHHTDPTLEATIKPQTELKIEVRIESSIDHSIPLQSEHSVETVAEPKIEATENSIHQQCVANAERNIRENQLRQYSQFLKQLEEKRDEFHQRYPDDLDDDVTKAYGAACQLLNILYGYAESYKNQDINLDEFKEHSSRVIKDRRNGVLGEHRGYKELLTNLLLAIGTLGIGYAIAALFTQSLTPIKCNTKTTNLLVDTEESLISVGKMEF